jgi:hypothetical protein
MRGIVEKALARQQENLLEYQKKFAEAEPMDKPIWEGEIQRTKAAIRHFDKEVRFFTQAPVVTPDWVREDGNYFRLADQEEDEETRRKRETKEVSTPHVLT